MASHKRSASRDNSESESESVHVVVPKKKLKATDQIPKPTVVLPYAYEVIVITINVRNGDRNGDWPCASFESQSSTYYLDVNSVEQGVLELIDRELQEAAKRARDNVDEMGEEWILDPLKWLAKGESEGIGGHGSTTISPGLKALDARSRGVWYETGMIAGCFERRVQCVCGVGDY